MARLPKRLLAKFKNVMKTQEGVNFYNDWEEKSMGDFLRNFGGATNEQVDRIFANSVTADLSAVSERGWQRSALTNGNYGSADKNLVTEDWLNFARGAGMFKGAESVYKTLSKSRGFTPRTQSEAADRFNNALNRITPAVNEDIERMKGYFGRGTAALKEREAAKRVKIAQDNARDKALRTTVRREVNQYEDSVRNSSDFQEAVRANIEREKIADKQQAMLDNAHKNADLLQNPLAMRVARENNLDLSNPQQLEKLQSIISTANKQGAARAAEIGSGKTLQEGTVSIPWTDTEKQAGIRNLREQPGGMPVEDSPLYDEETLLAKMGGNKNNFGYSDASKYRLKQVKQKLDNDYETIIKNGGTFKEQQAAWKKTQDEAVKMLEEGPDLADYAFGNNLHYKGLGFAAMVGLTGVAFGGAKSNAQLYSSPF